MSWSCTAQPESGLAAEAATAPELLSTEREDSQSRNESTLEIRTVSDASQMLHHNQSLDNQISQDPASCLQNGSIFVMTKNSDELFTFTSPEDLKKSSGNLPNLKSLFQPESLFDESNGL